MEKVDVAVNVFGKTWQTLVTLKSLITQSGKYIDKIYFIEEAKQPDSLNFNFIKEKLGYENLIHYKTSEYLWVNQININKYKTDKSYKNSIRYQFAIDNTDKDKILILHNDVLFTSDGLSKMIDEINNGFCGVGSLGQCWNCPLSYEKMCNSEVSQTINFTFEDILPIINKYPDTRTLLALNQNKIDRNNPYPLPECRLNEFVAMLDVNKYRKEVIPNNNVLPIGSHYTMDTGVDFYRGMLLKGYKFKNIDINEFSTHGFFSENGNGNSSLFDKNKFIKEEILAEEYFKRNYK